MNTYIATKQKTQESYYVNDLIGTKVVFHGKKIGTLRDIIATETETLPVVTHLYVSRLFGSPSLLIPWKNVRAMTRQEIVVHISSVQEYEGEPEDVSIKLKDQVLDKKVIDTEDRDVDVVYDVRLVRVSNRLFVSDVDTSNVGLLRRIGLEWLNRIFNKTPQRSKMISWKYIRHLSTPLGRFRGDVKLNVLKETLSEIDPVDLADILEELDYKERVAIFEHLDTEQASETLEEIDPKSQRELISVLKKERIVQLLTYMTAGQAADIISVLPHAEARTLLKLLEPRHVKKIKAIINRQEEDITNYATTKFIAYPPAMTVGDARKGYYQAAKNKKVVMYLYIVDAAGILRGVVDIKELLRGREKTQLEDIETNRVITLKPKSTLKQALTLFERYDYRAIPIVDQNRKIVGVVPYRDLKKLKHRFFE
jgi:magnesium transporter